MVRCRSAVAACSTSSAEFGTPVFIYDEAHLRARCREAVAAFGPGRAVYATKAFLCKAMARLAYDEGMLLDVASGGEMYVALVGRCAGERTHLPRQQQERRRAARGDHQRRAPHRRRQLRRARSARRAARRGPAGAGGAWLASRPACTPTRTSSSPRARTIPSSGSTSATATRNARSTACAAPTASSWSACIATSDPTCSPRPTSPRPRR